MDVLPHNTSAPLPDPCVRSDAPCSPSFQTSGNGSGELVVQADFLQAVEQVISLATAIFKSEIKQKQLYYHGLEHVQAVARRSLLIFDTVVPFYPVDDGPLRDSWASASLASASLASASASDASAGGVVTGWQRQRALLRLSAIAHDMIQLFVPQANPQTPRQRESGLSELKTFEHLRDFMARRADGARLPVFSAADIALVQRAIAATVCKIDPADGGIYQPLLYSQAIGQSALLPLAFLSHGEGQPAFSQLSPSCSLVPRCLALADIGTLGIDGIAAYQKEGSLLLLEENLDIVAFVTGARPFDAAAQEVLRQRLLKRARFQVVFAKSRLMRLDSELAGLPAEVIALLKKNVFKYLTTETITTIERITPTAESVSLKALLAFFQLEACLQKTS